VDIFGMTRKLLNWSQRPAPCDLGTFCRLPKLLAKHEEVPEMLCASQEGDMTTIGPVYPAQFVVSHAEVKLVADQTSDAGSLAIKADEQNLTSAQEVEAAESHQVDIAS
jgi:hypothetical protein